MAPSVPGTAGRKKRKRTEEERRWAEEARKAEEAFKKQVEEADFGPSQLQIDLALTGGKRKKYEPKPRPSTDHLPPRPPGRWQTWNYINRYRQKVRVWGRLLFSLRDYREIQCSDNTILTLIEIRITEMDEVTVRWPLDLCPK
jgi:hypothetical protein